MRKSAGWAAAAAGLATMVAGCTSYFRAEDAPASFANGFADPRLSLMQAFGPPLSPIVRNLRAPHGKLYRFREVEAMLRADLEPLDVVLVRSRPAMTRLFIPSHFTHAMVWLGTEGDLKARGIWLSAALKPYQASIRTGLTILESSKSSVHLSPFDEMIDVDEILVLRLTPKGSLPTKYAALFERLGTPFDVAFDLSDTTRLTCAELIAEVFPELKIPVRYASGRLAIIPDDIARLAVGRSAYLSVKRYIRAETGSFVVGTAADLGSRLTSPRSRQSNKAERSGLRPTAFALRIRRAGPDAGVFRQSIRLTQIRMENRVPGFERRYARRPPFSSSSSSVSAASPTTLSRPAAFAA